MRWSSDDEPYRDPQSAAYPPANFLLGLMRQPATTKVQPVENQMTEALAWLINRDQAFGRKLIARLEDAELQAAAGMCSLIGARTQLSLPHGNTTLLPDLTIEGSGGAFQVLVEVKVTAGFHTYQGDRGTLLQPDMYALAWERLNESLPPGVRLVTTLSNTPEVAEAHHPWRIKDLRWSEVAELLRETAGSSPVEPVASDVLQALEQRVLPLATPVDPQAHIKFLLAKEPFVAAVAQAMLPRLPITGAVHKPRKKIDYVGTYVYFTLDHLSQCFWIHASVENGRFNMAGEPASLIFEARAHSNALHKQPWIGRYESCGFTYGPDITGWKAPRMTFPLDGVDQLPDAPERVATIVEAALRSGGLLG